MAANDVALVPTLTATRLLVENRLAGLPADTAERARQVAHSQVEGVRIARRRR